MQAENLGDLKLFRVPQPTTVAAHAQKQVALMSAREVTLTPLRMGWIAFPGTQPAAIVLRMQNRKPDGLGIALPGGGVSVFEPHAGGMVRVGAGRVGDKAVGEKLEVSVGASPQVQVAVVQLAKARRGAKGQDYRVTITNANPFAVRFEGKLPAEGHYSRTSAPLTRQDGAQVWATSVPANGRASFAYHSGDDAN